MRVQSKDADELRRSRELLDEIRRQLDHLLQAMSPPELPDEPRSPGWRDQHSHDITRYYGVREGLHQAWLVVTTAQTDLHAEIREPRPE